MMSDVLRLEFLGGFHATAGGEPITGFISSKSQALLCYLAVTGRPHLRSALAALLWGDMPEADAAANLRQALANLKRLAEPHLIITRQTVAFDLESPYWLDVEQFATALQPGAAPLPIEQLQAVVDLYHGDFLRGFAVREALDFEEWALAERERLHGLAIYAFHELVRRRMERGEYEQAIAVARRLLALEPWREEGHRQLMLLLARTGQRSAALAQYQKCEQILADELGVEPMPETVALYERIRTARPLSASTRSSHLAPLVGRSQERAIIAVRLADPACRLLTIVGPGGIGKTRLALETAADHEGRFFEGASVAYLAAVDSPGALVSTIATALGFSFHGAQTPRAQLLTFLERKELLLVLDNFEHLVEDGAELISDILRHAPDVKLLVTSRERLRVQGEWLLELQGLAAPRDALAGAVEEYSSVQLFVQNARRVQPGFTLTGEAGHVARICRLVEGMPLAIELAAAWVRVLSCAEIAEELENTLEILWTSLRDIPERHRSLVAVFDYSWQFLSAEERRVLARLSVCGGGFQRTAAGPVAGAALRHLLALVDKSLLRRSGSDRYEMHELIRQYAAIKLREIPLDEAQAVSAHCRYYAEFLHRLVPQLKGAGQQAALEQISAEIENARRAWQVAVEQRRVDELGMALDALFIFLDIRGWFHEGIELLSRALAVVEGAGPTNLTRHEQLLAARLRGRLGRLHYRLSLYNDARDLTEGSLRELRAFGAWGEVVTGLNSLAQVNWAHGRYEEAERLGREALGLSRELADQREAALALTVLGNIAYHQGEFEEARRLQGEALAIYRAIGNQRGAAIALNNLANATWETGATEAAEALYRESLALHRAVGDRLGMAFTAINLADAAFIFGRLGEAQEHFAESLQTFRELGERYGVAYCLNLLGSIRAARGAYAEARGDLEEALELFREIGQREGIAQALTNLGRVALGEGDAPGARGHYREALQVAMAINAMPVALEALVGSAEVLGRDGARGFGVEILRLGLSHPASAQQTRERAARLLAEMGEEPPREAAMSAGDAPLPVEAVVARLLELLA